MFLVSCNPSRDVTLEHIASNQTKNDIGFFVNGQSFGQQKVVVGASRFAVIRATANYRGGFPLPDYVIADLKDTTSIRTLASEWYRLLLEERPAETKRDSAIFNAVVVSDESNNILGFSWTVTDELVSVMEKDYALLDLFSEYYSQK